MILLRKVVVSFLLISGLNISLQAMLKTSMPVKTSQTARSKFLQYVSSLWSDSLSTDTSKVTVPSKKPASVHELSQISLAQSSIDKWFNGLERKGIQPKSIDDLFSDKIRFLKLSAQKEYLSEEINRFQEKYEQAKTPQERKRIKLHLRQLTRDLIAIENRRSEHQAIVEQRKRQNEGKDSFFNDEYKNMHDTYAWDPAKVHVDQLKRELKNLDAQIEQDKNKTDIESAEMGK